MKGTKRLLLILGGIAAFVILFSQCINNERQGTPITDSSYAGTKSCIQCHKAIYENYALNPHNKASTSIEGKNLGTGKKPASAVYAFDEHFKIAVEDLDSGMYQTVYIDDQPELSRRFDVAIGAGKNAITYGSWKDNNLYQMQLSYFSGINDWANSPGYPNKRIHFGRMISSGCLECHASMAKQKTETQGGLIISQQLLKSSLVYGINCERCHGPSGKHVEFHAQHPEVKMAKYMAQYRSLSRKQKTDACAVCHSGSDLIMKPTFGFKPGDRLEDYTGNEDLSKDTPNPDVHGQQYQMLSGSKCYTDGATLDCSTCHSMHERPAKSLSAYSKNCISCHTTIKHSGKTLQNAMVKSNCIDCHMPRQNSKAISFQMAGKSERSPYQLRTHLIKVY